MTTRKQNYNEEFEDVDGGDGPAVNVELKIGDFIFDEDEKSIIYKQSETGTINLGEPSDKKIYANAMTKRLYIWRGGTWRQCGTNAYTKAESDSRFAADQTVRDLQNRIQLIEEKIKAL